MDETCKEAKVENVIIRFADEVMPFLNGSETQIYLWFLINTYIKHSKRSVTIGYRGLAAKLGAEVLDHKLSDKTVRECIRSLKKKALIAVLGVVSNKGTKYHVNLPHEIKLCADRGHHGVRDRQAIFDRDDWRCQYCGEAVTPANAEIDHFISRSHGGTDGPSNLRTCCKSCNSIKQGKTYEEAAPAILKGIRERNSAYVPAERSGLNANTKENDNTA